MQYRVYTKTRQVRIPVVYQCEKCKNVNAIVHPFLVATRYNDQGVLTKKGLEKREESANVELRQQQDKLPETIRHAVATRNVKNAGFICKCSRCGFVPRWSCFRNAKWDKVCDILTHIAIMISAFLLLPLIDGDFSYLKSYLLPIGILAIAQVPRFILFQYKRKQVKALPETYMPILCTDQEEVDSALESFGVTIETANAK